MDNKLVITSGQREVGRSNPDIENWEVQAIMYKTHKQKWYTLQLREIWPLFCNNF